MPEGAERAIVRAAIELVSRHEREAVLETILAELERLVPFDVATVMVLDGLTLRIVAERGLRRDVDARKLRFAPAEHPRLERALASRGTVRFTDPTEPDPFDGLAGEDLERVHSCMAAPLRADGRLLGVVTTDAIMPGRFAFEHEEMLELFAALAAVALRNAELVAEIEQARARLAGEVDSLAAEIRTSAGTEIVGQSEPARRLREEIALVGPMDTTVLIMGETGTGKEMVARALHSASRRGTRPLIRFDCAGVAPSLIESELYGHVRGAFTGAVAARPGRFEVADGSTLFLDEIGELPLEQQPRLLRALQEREIERVGDNRVRRFDVRVIAATNRDLAGEVRAGRFRADLFHRLAVYPIRVPPLGERLDDLPDLVEHFVRKLTPRLKPGDVTIEPGFVEALQTAKWPGNIRELENAVERALVRSRGGGGRTHLDARAARSLGLAAEQPPARTEASPVRTSDDEVPLKAAVEAFELARIEETLLRCGGNLSAAARRLGEDRSNLHRLLARLRRKTLDTPGS